MEFFHILFTWQVNLLNVIQTKGYTLNYPPFSFHIVIIWVIICESFVKDFNIRILR